MTFKEFNEIIKKDAELFSKYESAKEACSKDGIDDKFELLSKAAAKLGYEVPASEFKLNKITAKVLNEKELEAVTGGGRGGVDCINDFTDTDCVLSDYCQLVINYYKLYSCLYTHDGVCALEDACTTFDTEYYCDGNYLYNK